MLRRSASYIRRHHLALLALFIALGGTSVAAGNAVLPRNSVGTRQVVDGSLQTNDLSSKARNALKGSTLRGLHLYTSRTGTSTVNVQIFDEKNNPLDRPFSLAVVF